MKICALEQQLALWSPGALQLNSPALPHELNELSDEIEHPLPKEYTDILRQFNGAQFPGETVYGAKKVLTQWQQLPAMTNPFYVNDPDWPGERPAPTDLVPIGEDAMQNLHCLDLSTAEMEVVEWNPETGLITTINADAVSWLVTKLKLLAIQFDYHGRPRPMRPGHAQSIEAERIKVQLEVEPNGALPRLEMAQWLAANSTPEDALFAYRKAAQGKPETALNHYMHGLFSISQKRFSEARKAMRRAVESPVNANPRKHSFRAGVLPAAHKLLALLYDNVRQTKKADEQHKKHERTAQKYGFGWYEESPDYQRALSVLMVD